MKVCVLIFLINIILFIPQAYAVNGECHIQKIEIINTEISNLASAVVGNGLKDLLWPCTLKVAQGIWASTGGSVVDTTECLLHPIDCANKGIKSVEELWNFMSDIENNLKTTYESISHLSMEQKAEIICDIVGMGLGAVLITIVSAGTGSGVFAKFSAELGTKFAKLANILNKIPDLPYKKLKGLDDAFLNAADELTTMGYGSLVKKYINLCPL